jgi:hypothetical protein
MRPRVKRNLAKLRGGAGGSSVRGRGQRRPRGQGPGGAGLEPPSFIVAPFGHRSFSRLTQTRPLPGPACAGFAGRLMGVWPPSVEHRVSPNPHGGALGPETFGRPSGRRSSAAVADHSVIRVHAAHQIGLFGPACGSGRNLSPWPGATGSSRGSPDLRSVTHGPRCSPLGRLDGDPARGPFGSSNLGTGQPPARPRHAVLHRGFAWRRRGNGGIACPAAWRQIAGRTSIPALPPSPRYEASVQTA